MIEKNMNMMNSERNTAERKSMKTESEIYLETGILGGYLPEKITQRRLEGGKIMPIFRDTVCTVENGRIELKRQMIIGGRTFIVRSIFDAESDKTATDRLLRVIDGDLSKLTK